jgi:putative polyketide hydroxylase
MHTEEVPVLVVGGGPAGLAAAAELARHEIATLLVERRVVLSSHPRATVLSLRSMELMRAWGVEAVVRSRDLEVDNRMLDAETLADAASGSLLWVGYPNREQSRALSPVDVACVAQDEVEPLLLAHLREQPSAQVSLGTELTRVWVGVDGVRATLRDLRTGSLRSVHARYLVVADGARSAVRGALGIGLLGPEDVMAGVTTLFRAPLWDVVGTHRHLIYSVNQPDAAGVFLPAGQGDRWLYGSAAVDATRAHDGHAADLVRLGAGVPDLPVRIEGARVLGRRAARGVLPLRPRLPRRRRRSPGDAAWRDRAEPRAARRPRHRLEAGVGGARLGGRRVARQLRGRAPSGGGVRRLTVGGPARLVPRARP